MKVHKKRCFFAIDNKNLSKKEYEMRADVHLKALLNDLVKQASESEYQ
jgi:hypothetical protein